MDAEEHVGSHLNVSSSRGGPCLLMMFVCVDEIENTHGMEWNLM